VRFRRQAVESDWCILEAFLALLARSK